MTRISAVLACRNEESCIGAWLEETATYADEILIALHAPTDATPDIIAKFKSHSAIPVQCCWFPAATTARFGFSLMKNELLARAQGDWITSIDADEQIAATRDQLEKVLAEAIRNDQESVSMHWSTCDAAHRGGPLMDLAVQRATGVCGVRKSKLIRSRRGFWWRGLIHEELFQQSIPLNSNTFASELNLVHYPQRGSVTTEWKDGLYAHLICRIRDHPHLRAGTNRWWYEDNFVSSEASHRAAASLFEERFQEWFPDVARRCPV